MNFTHGQQLIEKFPNNFTGVIFVKEFSNYQRISRNLEYFKSDLFSEEFVASSRMAAEKWQNIFSKMGAKPKYKSSLGSLLDYFSRENKLYRIHPIVDLYNYYSLIKGFPMGAYDASKISGSLRLDIVGKGNDFTPLGSPKIIEKTKENEVAYFDQEKVICRYWNLQDCDQTKITDSIKDILFIFDLIFENSVEAEKKFRHIVSDFNKFFADFDEEVEFSGITGHGLSNELVF